MEYQSNVWNKIIDFLPSFSSFQFHLQLCMRVVAQFVDSVFFCGIVVQSTVRMKMKLNEKQTETRHFALNFKDCSPPMILIYILYLFTLIVAISYEFFFLFLIFILIMRWPG